MNSTRPTEVRRWLAEANIRPSRRLGQNFLVDGNIARVAVSLAGLCPGDGVLEIGPGCGALTELLLAQHCRVTAVEVDRRLVDLLRQRFGASPRLALYCADALNADLGQWIREGFDVVVANLPYSVGTRILIRLFELHPPPRRLVVTLQREVVERLIAIPRAPSYGLLSIVAQHLYQISRPRVIPPSCFHPAPEVESALVRMDLRDAPLGDPVEIAPLVRRLKDVFGARRKQLRRALERANLHPEQLDHDDGWRRLGISPTDRPDALDPAKWTRLARALGVPPPRVGAGSCA
ncbi:MAG: 16S rRNA (adenine(1518)-N(6)/adenine(1519)-N(6))-dimethyltransferase RsmA [Kiritimatiellae bacterium]|nr:16S rRNA (adenine(1518)-N(6)/adenine(1519)-N(6))-dimethyltransferase RsmA [Kiritimatiellia bacterium]